MVDLTPEERELLLWALSWVEGAASEMDDYDTGKKVWTLAEKIREG